MLGGTTTMKKQLVTPNYLPLYRQVKDLLLQRLIDGVWAPGMVLPSEQQLAEEFGVSQGTVRKALDEMTADNILTRRQGRGTFVSQHSPDRSLFHFFYIVSKDGKREIPESKVIRVQKVAANSQEIKHLNLDKGDKVVRIKRVRYLHQQPVIVETISLALKLFGDIGKEGELPNTLYSLYESEYGVKVMKAVERVRAVSLSEDDAELLQMPPQSPVLEIDRIAVAINGQPVERRISYVNTENHHYLSELL